MIRIVYDPEIENYLNKLVTILYENKYLSSKSTAYDYVSQIIDTIEKEISVKPYKPAPPHFDQYGKDLVYVVFKRNNNTQWYVFFKPIDDIFYIRYIGNNHTCAQYITEYSR